ncbi:hypothetical protein EMIT0215P_10164 [Pseudomonas serboccidentalis]
MCIHRTPFRRSNCHPNAVIKGNQIHLTIVRIRLRNDGADLSFWQGETYLPGLPGTIATMRNH